MYQSAKLLVRRPPATGWYHQNRPSAVNFGRQRSIEGEIDHRQSIEREKGKKKKKRKRKMKKRRRRKKKTTFHHAVLARSLSSASSPLGTELMLGNLEKNLHSISKQIKNIESKENLRIMPE
ncbi:hypothetical protein BHE74_00021658 [Ensete ventricosum]|nr:hypothetical protein GW17_00002533 [Ensete ventricosum]RWW70646.1 hypothetical protein BHE74_00021658 [Ensete ventricosum]RZS00362.1 hypothetical protein BHM03_00030057 [Ensete ventricosum]